MGVKYANKKNKLSEIETTDPVELPENLFSKESLLKQKAALEKKRTEDNETIDQMIAKIDQRLDECEKLGVKTAAEIKSEE